jgi:hypothetical protein
VKCQGWSKRTVDDALGVADDLLDLALLLKIGERTTGKRAVDLQSVDKGGDGDEAVGLNLLLETVRSSLVEDDGVLGLVLDCVRIMSAKLFLYAAPWRGVRDVRFRGLGVLRVWRSEMRWIMMMGGSWFR